MYHVDAIPYKKSIYSPLPFSITEKEEQSEMEKS